MTRIFLTLKLFYLQFFWLAQVGHNGHYCWTAGSPFMGIHCQLIWQVGVPARLLPNNGYVGDPPLQKLDAKAKPDNRKRGWLGPNPEDSFNKRKRQFADSEGADPTTKFKKSSSPSRSLVSRCEDLPAAGMTQPSIKLLVMMWSTCTWKIFQESTEYVQQKWPLLTGDGKFFKADVYHRRGSFITDAKMVAITGIHSRDLKNGLRMHEVRARLEEELTGKLLLLMVSLTFYPWILK